MDFKEISDFFGGTIFPEEYRGDFKLIEVRINGLEKHLSLSSSAEDRAKVFLLRAILSMLTGDLKRASSFLEKILASGTELDLRWRARCRAYKFRIFSMQRVPPAIRFRPELSSSSSPIRDAELNTLKEVNEMVSFRRNIRFRGVPLIDQLESGLFLSTYTFNTGLWLWSFSFHPKYPPNQMRVMFSPSKALSKSVEFVPAEFVDLSSRLNLPSILTYLERLRLEMDLGQALPQSSMRFQNIHNICQAVRDVVGLAILKIIEGDSIVSPPFSSPIALNLVPLDHGPGWVNEDWDSLEPSFPLRDDWKAQMCYNEALRLLHGTGAPRAQAAVVLRQGCIQHAEAIRCISAGRTHEGERLFENAQESLDQAKRLFRLDQANTQVVLCHQALLNISRGRYEDVLNQASAIGSWGLNAENTGLSQFLGLLFVRFGRRQYLDYGQVDLGLRCCACARACFAASQEIVLELQALVAQADLHYESGSTVLAQIKIDEAADDSGLLDRVMSYVEMMKSMQGAEVETLEVLRFNILSFADRVASKIYSVASDRSLLSRWAAKNRKLRESGYALEIVQKSLGAPKPDLYKYFNGGVSTTDQTNADSSTSTLSIKSMVDILEKDQKLYEDYYQILQKSNKAGQAFDIDKSDACLRDFICSCERAVDTSAFTRNLIKVVVFSLLGESSASQQILLQALPVEFGGSGKYPFQSFSFTVEGVPVDFQRMSDAAERAIALCFLARHWKRGAQVLLAIGRLLPHFLDLNTSPQSDSSWQRMTWIGSLYEHSDRFETAFEWYLQAQRLVETRRSKTSDLEARRDVLSTIHTGELFVSLARISLVFAERSSNIEKHKPPSHWFLRGPNWKEQALIFLEQGRARALLDLMIAQKEVKPELFQTWAAETYKAHLLADLKVLPEGPRRNEVKSKIEAEFGDDPENVAKQIETQSLTMASILPATRFSTGTTELFKCIPANAIVVEISLGREGMLLFCATRYGIEFIRQSNVTDIEIRRHVCHYLKLLRDESNNSSKESLTEIAQSISSEIIEPIAHVVRNVEHVIFVPSHTLHIFPFCALILDKKPLFLQKAVSQVPSLSTLQHLARKQRDEVPQALKVSVIAKPGVASSDDKDFKPIESSILISGLEALAIAHTFDSVPQNAKDLGQAQFTDLFEQSDIIHIGTHGLLAADSPWYSEISLQQKFRVLDLAKLRSRALLVVFGACLSGLGKVTTGNDIVGFSHAVLQSGALVYVGGLWKVNDETSMLQMVLFYRRLLKSVTTGWSIAECWRQAQVELYELDMEKTTAIYREMKDLLDQPNREGVKVDAIVKNPQGILEQLIEELEDEDEIDFSHPYYWAPFTMVGYAGIPIHMSQVQTSHVGASEGPQNVRPPPLPRRKPVPGQSMQSLPLPSRTLPTAVTHRSRPSHKEDEDQPPPPLPPRPRASQKPEQKPYG